MTKHNIRLEPYLKRALLQHEITDFPKVRSWKYNAEFVAPNTIEMTNIGEFFKMMRKSPKGTLYIDSQGTQIGYFGESKNPPIDFEFPHAIMLFIDPLGIMYYINGRSNITQEPNGEISRLTFGSGPWGKTNYYYYLIVANKAAEKGKRCQVDQYFVE